MNPAGWQKSYRVYHVAVTILQISNCVVFDKLNGFQILFLSVLQSATTDQKWM